MALCKLISSQIKHYLGKKRKSSNSVQPCPRSSSTTMKTQRRWVQAVGKGGFRSEGMGINNLVLVLSAQLPALLGLPAAPQPPGCPRCPPSGPCQPGGCAW